METIFTTVLHLPTEDRSAQRSLELHFLKILPKARSSRLTTNSHVQCSSQKVTSDLTDLRLDTVRHSSFQTGFAHRYKAGYNIEVFFQYYVKLSCKSLTFDWFGSYSNGIFKSYQCQCFAPIQIQTKIVLLLRPQTAAILSAEMTSTDLWKHQINVGAMYKVYGIPEHYISSHPRLLLYKRYVHATDLPYLWHCQRLNLKYGKTKYWDYLITFTRCPWLPHIPDVNVLGYMHLREDLVFHFQGRYFLQGAIKTPSKITETQL